MSSKATQHVYQQQALQQINYNDLITNVITDMRNGLGGPAEIAKKYGLTKEETRKLLDKAMQELISLRLQTTDQFRAISLDRNEGIRAMIFARFTDEDLNGSLSNSAFTNLINLALKTEEQYHKLTALYTTKIEFTQIIKPQLSLQHAAEFGALLSKFNQLGDTTLPSIEVYESEIIEMQAADKAVQLQQAAALIEYEQVKLEVEDTEEV